MPASSRSTTRAVIAVLAVACAGCTLIYSVDGLSGADALPLEAGADGGPLQQDASPDAPNTPDANLSAYTQAVLADGPSAYYRFEEPTPTLALDSSGHGRDGTYVGNVTFAPGALSGETSHAIHLNGSSAWVRIGDLLHFSGRAPLTIEAWVKADALTAYHGIVTNENPALRGGYRLLVSPSEGFSMERVRPPGDAGSDDTNVLPPPPLATWTHVVATYDGSIVIVYLDGQERARQTYPIDIDAPIDAVLAIGARASGKNGYFAGLLDEVALYEHVLSVTSIAKHYNVGRGF